MSKTNLRQRSNKRYLISATLETATGLHVGSGSGNERTDATIVRNVWGRPYLPGSSFKGVMRSTIERQIEALVSPSLHTCLLSEGMANCLTTDAGRQEMYQGKLESREPEEALMRFLESDSGLCDTCRLFGSPYSQSRLFVQDLHLEGDPAVATEVRHGVGIDRETLTARERIKFDYEVLPTMNKFTCELMLERPSALDWGLLALGLLEMTAGDVSFGGRRSRGLGRVVLQLNSIRVLDLADAQQVVRALSTKEFPRVSQGPREFLQAQLQAVLNSVQEHTGAQDVSTATQ